MLFYDQNDQADEVNEISKFKLIGSGTSEETENAYLKIGQEMAKSKPDDI